MKILKKINKGLVLTIIVIIALTMYLVGVEKQRAADKEVINKACEGFLEFTDKYLVYPEDMQKLNETISESRKKEYINEMKRELKKLMIENDEAVEIQYDVLGQILVSQDNKNEKRTEIDRKITKITGYEFDGNQVTVTFNSKIDISSKYLDSGEEMTRKNSYETTHDEIVLQKVDKDWKIVSANLRYYGYNNYYAESVVMY